MESKRPFVIAAICGAISLLLIYAYTFELTKQMTDGFGPEVGVVMAARYIPEYTVITPDMLQVVPVFKKFAEPQTVTAIAGDAASEKAAFSQIVGKATYVPIYANEQVTLTKLVTQDGKPVLDRQVEMKMRAVTLQVSPGSGVGHLIRPGNRIDIMAAVSYEQGAALQYEVKTVFQNVLVLATGKSLQDSVPTLVNKSVLTAIQATFEDQHRKDIYSTNVDSSQTSKPDDNYSTVTVQLNPEDAEKLIYIQHALGDSRLYLTLRNGADQQVIAKLDTTILDQVLGPDSDYGRGKVRLPPAQMPQPRYYDSRGGQAVPVY